ncbi:autotransporter domain-containing protein [Aestuariirhabdus haliotis]|uniref:autotransporter domain-containing protein n=1 Tax=Aestuariirhabdus haliotis TaxID=2918751 RepID=UPI0020BEDC15|nr:autotransporter domain-containing protein [Aestuariirhabdus haliotis]MCL6420735.1 autotransporter domain-containing protein [Aestuariirhabdus haliotis]
MGYKNRAWGTAGVMMAALGSTSLHAEVINLGMGPINASDISADGTVVVGRSGGLSGPSQAIRWTQGAGIETLNDLAGGIDNYLASDVSADGNNIVGYSNTPAGFRAVIWQGGGLTPTIIPFVTTRGASDRNLANAISADGLVVVGDDNTTAGQDQAFRWTQAGGSVSLGSLTGSMGGSNAADVSSDGSVVVGFSRNASSSNEAFRWTQASGMVGLGILTGFDRSSAAAVNADGSVVVGSLTKDTSPGFHRAFRWEGGTMANLGVVAGNTSSYATGVSDNGSVVVGFSDQDAFRWTAASGMQTVKAWLEGNGVEVDPALSLKRATAVNADGSVIVGESNDGAFLARSTGSIGFNEYGASLQGNALVQSAMFAKNDMLMNGLHSNPLSRRVDAGQRCFRIGGDWGRDNHDDRNGSLGMAEATGCYNFGTVQVNFSLGKSWASDYDLYQNGDLDADETYVVGELLAPLFDMSDSQVWGALTAIYGHGEADIKRGYLNAGLPTSSKGSPDIETRGIRAHLEWDNAWQLSSTRINPYVSASYVENSVDSYTETGGGFPARFDKQTNYAADVRLGLQGLTRIDEQLRFTSQFEGVHSDDDEGHRVSGQIIGLSAFDLKGSDSKQNWLKLGLGIEYDVVESGMFSFSLNGTTEGQAPSYWVSTGYQYNF